MRIDDINQLPAVIERAVIINVGTEVVTSLAIASALRNAEMPLLVVNCTPGSVSDGLLGSLSDSWGFHLINLPLAQHGVTLDRLFDEVKAERILLIDSDAEIRSRSAIVRMRAAFVDPKVYGSGWAQPNDWLGPEQSGVSFPVVYRARPWIPCAIFRTTYIRAALAAGASFAERFIVGSGIADWDLPPEFVTQNPMAGHGDTGAEMHAWALGHGFRFDGPSISENHDDVAHYHGVSRLHLAPESPNGTPLDSIEQEVLERLSSQYSAMFGAFAQAVKVAQALCIGV